MKPHDSLKLLNVRLALYIPTQQAVVLSTCLIDRFLAEQRLRSVWSVTRIQNNTRSKVKTRTTTKCGWFRKIMKRAHRRSHSRLVEQETRRRLQTKWSSLREEAEKAGRVRCYFLLTYVLFPLFLCFFWGHVACPNVQ